MNRSEIQARREKVAYYLVKGMPEGRIAKLLGVNRMTLARKLESLTILFPASVGMVTLTANLMLFDDLYRTYV